MPQRARLIIGRSFLSNAGIMGVAQAIYAACQWGTLIVLARLGGPEMVGRFALALAITAPVMLFSNLALRAALVTDVRGEHPLRRYLALRSSTAMLGLAMVGVIVLAIGYDRDAALLVVAVALAKGFENLSDILYGIAQRRERFALIAVSLGSRAVLGLFGMAAAIWLTGDVVYGAFALALAWALVLAFHDWPATAAWRRASAPAGPPHTWLLLAWSVLPLAVAAPLISLNGNLPRYVIAERFGEAELGVFAAMAYLVHTGVMLINVFGQAASPRLARAGADRDTEAYFGLLAALLSVSVVLGAAGILLAAFFSEPVLRFLYGSDFLGGTDLLVWVMGVALLSFVASCCGFGATALRIFRPAPVVHGVTLATNFVACMVLARHGIQAVLVAWMASLLINSLLQVYLILRHWRSVPRQGINDTTSFAAAKQVLR